MDDEGWERLAAEGRRLWAERYGSPMFTGKVDRPRLPRRADLSIEEEYLIAVAYETDEEQAARRAVLESLVAEETKHLRVVGE